MFHHQYFFVCLKLGDWPPKKAEFRETFGRPYNVLNSILNKWCWFWSWIGADFERFWCWFPWILRILPTFFGNRCLSFHQHVPIGNSTYFYSMSGCQKYRVSRYLFDCLYCSLNMFFVNARKDRVLYFSIPWGVAIAGGEAFGHWGVPRCGTMSFLQPVMVGEWDVKMAGLPRFTTAKLIYR